MKATQGLLFEQTYSVGVQAACYMIPLYWRQYSPHQSTKKSLVRIVIKATLKCFPWFYANASAKSQQTSNDVK